MAKIDMIEARVTTADVPGASTDGDVFLGLCGREFNLDLPEHDDFQQGQTDTFVLGNGPNVSYASFNDPREPQLDTKDLSMFPKYIRFEPRAALSDPDQGWWLEGVTVTINTDAEKIQFTAMKTTGSKAITRIYLSQRSGKICYMK